jgi:metallo-beta-lactamase class B
MKYFLWLFLVPVLLFGQPRHKVELLKIEDSVWVHRTYKSFGQSLIASNGLLVQTSSGILLIDTPWDDSLTMDLLDVSKKRLNQDVTLALITHAHADRIGGIHSLHKNGIKVISNAMACRKAKELGYEVPDPVVSTDTTFFFGNEQIEYFYPGAGHTIDNSIVWLSKRKILFGGCLVKAESAADLGNTEDAHLQEWPRSIHVLMEKFPEAHWVVPGHGTWGDLKLLLHTMNLLSAKME